MYLLLTILFTIKLYAHIDIFKTEYFTYQKTLHIKKLLHIKNITSYTIVACL